MDSEVTHVELVARLKCLDASAHPAVPGFDYDGLLVRHEAGRRRARRRDALARGSAMAMLVALVGASLWRLDGRGVATPAPVAVAQPEASQPRMVRADTYLAVAALEDHIASVDDALNYARLNGGGAEVARLERTRAELFDSYTRVRYAEMVNANF